MGEAKPNTQIFRELARRMGGGDKPRTSIGGVTILSRVLERLKPQCTRIILNANGDLARANFTGDYSPRLLRTETIDGASTYVLVPGVVSMSVWKSP